MSPAELDDRAFSLVVKRHFRIVERWVRFPQGPMDSKRLGILGEKIAEKYLKKKGYRILDKNYSSKFVSGPQRGEIDIVAKPRRNILDILRGEKSDTIHFVEVKALLSKNGQEPFSDISPEEKFNLAKKRKIIKMAEGWLIEKKIPLDSKWQIDVISIKINLGNKKAKILYFSNVACE